VAQDSLDQAQDLENLNDPVLFLSPFYLRNFEEALASLGRITLLTLGLIGMERDACLNFLGQNLDSGAGHSLYQKVLGYTATSSWHYPGETGKDIIIIGRKSGAGVTYM
jgi:hypothetical protein